MQSTFSRKFLGFRAACPLVGETFRALSSSSTLQLLRILYQHEISKHLPPISPWVKGILSRLWKEYCVQHPSGRLVKILKMISVKLFISPPPLSTVETLSLPNRSETLPGGWESDGINKYPLHGEKHTPSTHILWGQNKNHIDKDQPGGMASRKDLRCFKLTFGKYGDT